MPFVKFSHTSLLAEVSGLFGSLLFVLQEVEVSVFGIVLEDLETVVNACAVEDGLLCFLLLELLVQIGSIGFRLLFGGSSLGCALPMGGEDDSLLLGRICVIMHSL
jgi:hypothetical protein